jgi:C-terminal processing protease CtpA/Prc
LLFYSGKELIKQESLKPSASVSSKQSDWNNIVSFDTNYKYKFKNTYIIRSVVKNSVADKAGLKAGDTVLSINTTFVYNYTLSDIVNKLQERENKKIRITIRRDGQKMTFSFRLEKRI